MIDPSVMSDIEIEEYVRQAIATSGDPSADPGPLVIALRNAAARERSLDDPLWVDLTNQQAAEFVGDTWSPPQREAR